MNKNRPVKYATGERPEDDREMTVDPFLVAAQRARLPRGMMETGIADPSRESDPARCRRLYFEINASALGALIGNHPDLWMDEYHSYVRARRSGDVESITEYAEKFTTGQVVEPSGRFDMK